MAEILQSLEDLKSYVAERIEEQRGRPTSGLIHSLMTAEVDGHRLSDEEVREAVSLLKGEVQV